MAGAAIMRSAVLGLAGLATGMLMREPPLPVAETHGDEVVFAHDDPVEDEPPVIRLVTGRPISISSRPGSIFGAQGVATKEEAVLSLMHSPASCVSLYPGNVTHFELRAQDIYDRRALEPGSLLAGKTSFCKGDARTMEIYYKLLNSGQHKRLIPQIRKSYSSQGYAILVNVFATHGSHYRNLVSSVRLQAAPLLLVSVFASLAEAQMLYAMCGNCFVESPVGMRSLVFNHPVEHADKLRFQAGKRLWALEAIKQEHILVIDSDTSLLQPINMPEVVSRYEHVLYKTKSRKGIDGHILANVNRALGTTFDFFPLEVPWLYSKTLLRRLMKEVRLSKSGDWVDDLMKYKGPLYDLVLYRLFILKTEPGFFTKQIDVRDSLDTLIYESGLNDTQRARMPAPPIGTTCRNQRQHPCLTCLMVLNNLKCT